MPTYAFNSLETPDVASLQLDDDTNLRCYVWTQTPMASGFDEQTIESEIRKVLDGGEEVVVWRSRVRTPETAGHLVDSPRVLACVDISGDPFFVVHWIEGEADPGPPKLFMTFLDPTATNWEWGFQDSIPTSGAWQYDAVAVAGAGAAGYVVVHRETDTKFTSYRFSDVVDWGNFDWTASHTTDSEPGGVLTAYAHRGDGTFAYAYEREFGGANEGELWCRRYDEDTGADAASWQAMSGLGQAAFVCGGWEYVSSLRWVLGLEIKPFFDDDGTPTLYDFDLSAVVWQRQIPSATPSATGGAGRAYNLRLLSRPMARANGATNGLTRIPYAIVAHSEYKQSHYGQSHAFLVELPNMDDDFEARVLLSGSLNLRLVDARANGAHPAGVGRNPNGRRTNHVSSIALPSFSNPDKGFTSEVKAYTAALCVYTRVVAAPNSFAAQPNATAIVPQQTSVVSYSVHLEEPWIRHRDAVDVGANTKNFKGPYAQHPYAPFPAADMLIIGGGLPQVYDGQAAVEIGWTWYPEILATTQQNGVTGNLDTGEYTYTAIYERVHANGRVERSAPSTPVEFEVTNNEADGYLVTVTVKTNTLSAWFDVEAGHPNAHIVLYRADPGSVVFRRCYGQISGGVAEIQDTAHNLPDVSEVEIVDRDGDISNSDILPWQIADGQWTPLTPTMPPASCVGFVWRDRIVLVPSEEPNTFWYSLALKPGRGSSAIGSPEFSATNVYRFDGEALRVTAGLVMDDHAIVFAEDAIYALVGRFNDDNGFGADLQLTLIHRGVGCIDQNSVVRTDIGTFFQSHRGIEFMDKSWALSNVTIGSSVEDDVALCGNLRNAVWIEERRQVRWLGNVDGEGEPISLVYHYVEKIWTRYTLPEGDQTVIGDGDSWLSQAQDGAVLHAASEQLHVVLQQGALLIERESDDASPHFDQVRSTTSGNSTNSANYNGFDVEIAWLSFAGLTGYQRVWKVLVVHDPIVADSPGIALHIDSDVRTGEYPDSGISTEVLNRSAPQGGVSDFRPSVQKVSGMRLRLRRAAGAFSALPTWSVLSFGLEVGVKLGGRKTSSAQRGT
jgi:hypothetical protein